MITTLQTDKTRDYGATVRRPGRTTARATREEVGSLTQCKFALACAVHVGNHQGALTGRLPDKGDLLPARRKRNVAVNMGSDLSRRSAGGGHAIECGEQFTARVLDVVKIIAIPGKR